MGNEAFYGDGLTWKEYKNRGNIREFKHDVYGRQQTAIITSVFLFFSCPQNSDISIFLFSEAQFNSTFILTLTRTYILWSYSELVNLQPKIIWFYQLGW